MGIFEDSRQLGFAKKLAHFLNVKVIAPTKEIAVDDLGNFIHDKGGKNIEFNP